MKYIKRLFKQKSNLIILFILAISFLFLSYKISKPFIGHHDWNAVFFGNIAKNTQKFGLLKTKFGAVYTFLPQTPSDFEFHTHQPPMLHLLLGLQAKLIGTKEWAMRLIIIFFSLVGVLYFFKTVKFLFNEKTAVLACLFYIFTPMFIYFGKSVVHEPIGLGLIAYSLYRHVKYFESQEKKNFVLLVYSIFITTQAVWAGYYLAPLYLLHFYVFNREKWRISKISFILLIPFFTFGLHLLHTLILSGSFDTGMFKTMFFRMGLSNKETIYQFNLIQYIKQEALWVTVYFSRILTGLNVIYILFLIKQFFKKRIDYKNGFIIMLYILGIIDVVIFKNLCFIHDYKLIFLIFGLSLGGAVALLRLINYLKFIWKNKKIASKITIGLIFILFTIERLEFTKTLLNTSMNKPAYELGLLLQDRLPENKAVMIGSPSFGEFLDIFLKFYGRRKAVYFYPNLEEFEEKYKDNVEMIVLVEGREKPKQELLDYLELNYYFFQQGNFTLYIRF